MKKIYFFILIYYFISNATVFAFGDSTRVSFCTVTGDDCFEKPAYMKTIDFIDSLGRVIRSDEYAMAGCWEGYIDSLFRKSASNVYQYDSNGNLIHHINTRFYFNDSTQKEYSYTYDSLNHLLSRSGVNSYPLPVNNFLFQAYEYAMDSMTSDLFMYNYGSGIDTVYFMTIVYDSINRKSTETYRGYDMSTHNLNSFNNQYYSYDSTGNLASFIIKNLLPPYDSTGVFYLYNLLNNISEEYYEQSDSLTSGWHINSKKLYVYDSLNFLERTYRIGCPTQACVDTTSYVDYTVDSVGNITHWRSYSFDGDWNGSSTIQYNIYGDTIVYGDGSSTANGCGESEYNYLDYNSSRQLVHSIKESLVACADRFYECYYYNLNRDSMVLDVSSPVTACAYDKVYPVIFHEGGAGPLTYHWSPGIYFSDSTTKYPYLINTDSCTYTLTVTDSLGRSISDTVKVNVYPNLIHPLEISTFGIPSCDGAVQLTFSPDSLNGTWNSYWKFDGSNYYQDSITANYSGLYSLFIYNNYCTYQTDTNLVLIEPVPLIINTIGSNNVCEGDSVILYTQEEVSFIWSTGSIADTIVAYSSGLYYISVVDSNSCPDTSNFINVYIDSFETDELLRDTTFCIGESVHLDPGFYYSYLWSDSSTLNYINVTTPGIYSLKVTNMFGCPNNDTIVVTGNLPPVVTLGNDTLLCQNTTMVLSPGNFQSYLWQDGSVDSVFTILYSGIDTLTYFVLVTDSNGCSASDSVHVFYDVCNGEVENQIILFEVWPSPADEILHFKFPQEKCELIVMNSLGELIYRGEMSGSESINCKNWPEGIYLLMRVSEKENFIVKILIQHS